MQNSDAIQITPSTKDVFMLAWPLGLKATMLHGIIVIDAYLVSALGEPALVALGLAGSIGGLLLGVLFSFSNATQFRVAQAFGTKQPVALTTGFYAGLLINLVATFAGLLLVWAVGGAIIEALAHTPWISEQANRYLAVFMVVVVSEAVGQCLTGHFNGCGNTRAPFHSYLIALPLNGVASLVFIYGYLGIPEMGLTGAAVGSAVGSFARVLFLGLRFYKIDRAFIEVPGWLRGRSGRPPGGILCFRFRLPGRSSA